LLLENLNIKNRKYEWVYLFISFSIYIAIHFKIMDENISSFFIFAFILLSISSMLLYKVKPNIVSTGALSYCFMLCWLFYYKGYNARASYEILFPYLLCASGVTVGMVITYVRNYELKFSAFREILETIIFTIFIGFWPIYPRLFATLNQIN
jgi:hypothetical protein